MNGLKDYLMRDMHKNKMCILNLYFPFSSPRLNDVRLVYIIYSLSVILVSLVSLATNKGDGRKQNYLYF